MLTLMMSLSTITMAKRYEVVPATPNNKVKLYVEVEKGSYSLEVVPVNEEDLHCYNYTKFYGKSIIWEENKRCIFQADRAYFKVFENGKILEEDRVWPLNGQVIITWISSKKLKVTLDHVNSNDKHTIEISLK